MDKGAKIYIAGHTGLVGRALLRKLKADGYSNIIVRSHEELDLLDQRAVEAFFAAEKPDYVFLAAAKVGGIMANKTAKADFIFENLQIQNNVIHSAWKYNVSKLLFLGSSCVYPRESPQPMKEEYFMDGKPEETNEAYAIAKIAGITMCQSYNEQYNTCFISVLPTNLYGPYDNFDTTTSHVIPALLRRFHEADQNRDSTVNVWGSGRPRREFMHVDDAADACVFIMENYNENQVLNVGTGNDISIAELVEMIREIVGYNGKVVWDTSKPDGVLQKRLDTTRLESLGWSPSKSLDQGLQETYRWFRTESKAL